MRRGGVRTPAMLATCAARVALPVTCGVLATGALLAAGCGEAQRDAHEQKRSYAVEVVRARFPRRQAVARDVSLELVVRNAGPRAIPNVTATVESFYYTSDYRLLAVNKRPVWIVNDGPGARANPPVESEAVDREGGASTAFVNTWSLGPLAAHARAVFLWQVTPVKPGGHIVHYTLGAGVDGHARATLRGGAPARGTLVAQIAPVPPHTHVNPETGRISPGSSPVAAGPVGAVP
ncbi:MAG TPA: hypothetical protein VHU13_02120 [Solirubrobacteraceae bacterium]|nr:hypothetical protein [Solirubrobacteraceae bacterium]